MRIVKKILKFGLYGVVAFLLFLVVLAGLTQTQFFRDRLRAAALSNLNSLLYAEVRLGDLKGNLVTGFTIDSIAISLDGESILTAERLDLRYNLFEIPGKTASFERITLVRPEVHLLRDREGKWNFRRMVRPLPADTSSGGSFDWVLHLRRFEIQEGALFLVDSASLADPDHPAQDPSTVEFHDFAVRKLNLVTSGSISSREKDLNIESLTFISDRPDVQLRHFSARILLTPSLARVSNLDIQTARSSIQLQASMKDVDLLGGINLAELRHKPVAVSLKAHNCDLDELKRFIPQLSFLHEPLGMDLEASGEFGNVNVQKLDLQLRHTRINLKGIVSNLHNPGDLRLNVKMSESRIVPADPLALMPDFHLPDLSAVGPVTLNLEFEGAPLDFRTKLHLQSEAGEIRSGNIFLKVGGPKGLAYKGDLALRGVNLAKIFNDRQLESKLQGTVVMDGEGVNLADLRGSMVARIDSSEFRLQPVSNSQITLNAENKRLHGNASVRLGGMSSSITASLDAEDRSRPRFTVDGSVQSLNFEDLFRNKNYNSDITMKLNVHGTGLSLDAVSGEALLELSSSRYGVYQLDDGNFHLLLDQHNPRDKTLRLESNLADVSMTGAFDLSSLTRLIHYEIQDLRFAVGTKFASLDSSLATSIDRRELLRMEDLFPAVQDSQDVNIAIVVKDLEPLSKVTADGKFNGSGFFAGSIKGDHRNLSCHGELTVNEFVYGNVDSGILIQDGMASFDIGRLAPSDPLKKIAIRLKAGAGSLHINNTALDSVSVVLAYQRELLDWRVRGELNNALRLSAAGSARVTEDSLSFKFDDLRAGYKGFAWGAKPGAGVQITGHGLELSKLVMNRDSQTVICSGKIQLGGLIEGKIEAQHIDLDDLRLLLPQEQWEENQKTFAGDAHVVAAVHGTLAKPEFAGNLRISDIALRGVPFGLLTGDLAYRDEMLEVNMSINKPTEHAGYTPELTMVGSIPLNLALKDAGERIPDVPIHLSLRSDGLQMSLFDPLLPTFRHLSGIMKCNLDIAGTLRKPDYNGNITIEDCSFQFVPNNIYYQFSGTFKPEGELIRVVKASVKNVAGDERGGRRGEIDITGDFSMRNLRPGDFNLTTTGDLLVVKETSQLTALSLYGNLFVEIGYGGLHFTGSIEESLLKGFLLIRNSSLVFPPAQASVAEESAMSVPLVVVDDTSHAAQPVGRPAFVRYFGLVRTAPGQMHAVSQPEVPGKSFMDGVRYDLNIETTGDNTEIRMIFNTISGEELVAALNGNISITEDGRRWLGELQISRAYYNFYKRFEAEGKIRYTGDLLNPELEITAKYQGQRTLRDSTVSARPEKIIVSFRITGSRLEPRIAFGMTINDINYDAYNGPTSKDVQSDAIQFILYGTFPLTTAQKNEIPTDVQKTFGLSFLTGATSVLTEKVSQYLRDETGFINSLELSYDGTGALGSSTDIRLSGVLGKGYWRYGGKILDDPLSNANFSLLYSFDAFFAEPSPWLRNLMFELERRVETGSNVQSFDIKRVNSARLFYRFSF